MKFPQIYTNIVGTRNMWDSPFPRADRPSEERGVRGLYIPTDNLSRTFNGDVKPIRKVIAIVYNTIIFTCVVDDSFVPASKLVRILTEK